jgi:hypothetical protein
METFKKVAALIFGLMNARITHFDTGCFISFEARQNSFMLTHKTISNHYISISASSTRDGLSNDILLDKICPYNNKNINMRMG